MYYYNVMIDDGTVRVYHREKSNIVRRFEVTMPTQAYNGGTIFFWDRQEVL